MTSDAESVLQACENKHCRWLYCYLVDENIGTDQLDYEDVFYPLRHHHADGLALELTTPNGTTRRYVWGSGDFIHLAGDLRQTFETAIDPFPLWEAIERGEATPDVTIVEEHREVNDG